MRAIKKDDMKMRRNWGTNEFSIGDVIRLDQGAFEHRMGPSWAKGRLIQGDVVVAVKHAGDCFFEFLLMDQRRYGEHLSLEPVSKPFGAHTMGRIIGGLSANELALLLDGETIEIPKPGAYDTPDGEKTTETRFSSYGDLIDAMKSIPASMLKNDVELFDESGRVTKGGHVIVDHGNRRVDIANID